MMNTQAVVFGVIVLFAGCWTAMAQDCADPDRVVTCTQTFTNESLALVQKITQSSANKQQYCQVLDKFIGCVKSACNVASLPQAQVDQLKKQLKDLGIECDLSNAMGGASAATGSLLLLSMVMLLVSASRE